MNAAKAKKAIEAAGLNIETAPITDIIDEILEALCVGVNLDGPAGDARFERLCLKADRLATIITR